MDDPSTLARPIVATVLDDLTGRSGLDGAWDSIDHDIREEIRQSLATRVQALLGEPALPEGWGWMAYPDGRPAPVAYLLHEDDDQVSVSVLAGELLIENMRGQGRDQHAPIAVVRAVLARAAPPEKPARDPGAILDAIVDWTADALPETREEVQAELAAAGIAPGVGERVRAEVARRKEEPLPSPEARKLLAEARGLLEQAEEIIRKRSTGSDVWLHEADALLRTLAEIALPEPVDLSGIRYEGDQSVAEEPPPAIRPGRYRWGVLLGVLSQGPGEAPDLWHWISGTTERIAVEDEIRAALANRALVPLEEPHEG